MTLPLWVTYSAMAFFLFSDIVLVCRNGTNFDIASSHSKSLFHVFGVLPSIIETILSCLRFLVNTYTSRRPEDNGARDAGGDGYAEDAGHQHSYTVAKTE